MSHPVDVHVGKRLKRIRTAMKLSQTDVARQLGLSFQQVQKYEIGSNRIAASRLFELSRIFNVPTAYFFEGLEDTENVDHQIVEAVARIDDTHLKQRIVTFIEDVSGQTVERLKAS